jgi:hypothetical protein
MLAGYYVLLHTTTMLAGYYVLVQPTLLAGYYVLVQTIMLAGYSMKTTGVQTTMFLYLTDKCLRTILAKDDFIGDRAASKDYTHSGDHPQHCNNFTANFQGGYDLAGERSQRRIIWFYQLFWSTLMQI